MLVVLYLAVTVLANLCGVWFGPAFAVPGALLFIGLDMATRDALHQRWERHALWRNMLLLIGAGSLLSWLLNAGAGRIALASFLAFALSATADAAVYEALQGQTPQVRANGSNLVSSVIDSTVFLTLAWGWLPTLILAQIAAKVAGGYIWSYLLHARRLRRT